MEVITMAEYIYKNGELYHAHKYIKKKKVNGKWRYYYDIGEPTAETYTWDKNGNKIRIDSRIKSYSKWQDIIGRDEQDAARRADYAYRKAYEQTTNRSMTREESVKASANAIKKGKESLKAHREYSKTLLGSQETIKNAIHKGKKAIGRLFIKLGKKLDGDNNSYYEYGMKKYK